MGESRIPGLAPTISTSLTGGEFAEAMTEPGHGQGADVVAGRYRLLGLLGRGGMGSVYRARDLVLDEVVALKVLQREMARSESMLVRFRQEVKLARRVTHPNVARTFDITEHDGQAFLTMEFVDGESLAQLLAREGALSVPRAVEIALALCDGLAAAHASGVIHRDLKPGNVLVARDGRIVVTDFGIARSFSDEKTGETLGEFVGTPAYMAPEQVEGASDVDPRADLYALGALLFELLTGRTAWTGKSAPLIAVARLMAPPPDPREHRGSLSPELARLVMTLMARRREDRPATAALARAALVQVNRSPASAPISLAPRTRPVADAARPPQEKAVAVLPFRNAGPTEDDYLADGLTEDLIDTLSMTRGLRLRPRGVVARLKSQDRDARELGAELGVDVVVEGSLRRVGPSFRITTRLISVADGFQIWATRLDRPMNDLLVVIDELARAVADALTEQAEERGRKAPSNPFAVEIYLRARLALRDGWYTAQGCNHALNLILQAQALSPDDAVLLGGAAIARVRAVHWSSLSREEATVELNLARKEARRALESEPRVGEPWLALAMVELYQGRAHDAVHPLTLALAASPQFAAGHELLGRVLLEGGLITEGMRFLNTALELDPENAEPRWHLARGAALVGDWERVDELLSVEVQGQAARLLRNITLARLHIWRRAAGLTDAPLTVEDFPRDSLATVVLAIMREVAQTGKMSAERLLDLRRLVFSLEGGLARRAQHAKMYLVEVLLAMGGRRSGLRCAGERGGARFRRLRLGEPLPPARSVAPRPALASPPRGDRDAGAPGLGGLAGHPRRPGCTQRRGGHRATTTRRWRDLRRAGLAAAPAAGERASRGRMTPLFAAMLRRYQEEHRDPSCPQNPCRRPRSLIGGPRVRAARSGRQSQRWWSSGPPGGRRARCCRWSQGRWRWGEPS
jgi:serine/threonine protein kinase/tetratricopeptide (TPR) repeat protein